MPVALSNSIRVLYVLVFCTIAGANTKLLAVTFAALILPVKFAVLPDSSKLTVTFGAITLPMKFAVLPIKARPTFALPLTKTSVKNVLAESAIPLTFDDIF